MNILRLLSALVVGALLLIFSYLFHDGIRVSEQVKIPGIARILNPAQGLWQNADRTASKTLNLPGLKEEVRIYYDERLVPHIFAANDEDALFAQGYVVASHRLWQMEFLSRLAAGRLSEVFGKATMNRDLLMRKYGLEYSAKKTVKDWAKYEADADKIARFNAGINHYIQEMDPIKDLSLEYKLANYSPRRWRDLDGALLSKYMSFTLARGNRDVFETNSRILLGEELYAELFLTQNQKQVPVIREDISEKFADERTKPDDIDYLDQPLIGLDYKNFEFVEGAGSNNWAVSGSKSTTSSPMLANDPHLQLGLPSIWYEMHIVTPESNSYGVTIPGVPGIIIGFNDHISYGSTNVGHDVLDHYTIDWIDEKKGTYRVDGQEKQAEIIPQVIEVKNNPDIKFDLKVTEFGPVIFESPVESTPDLAMQWIVHEKAIGPEMTGFFQAMKCKDYECYKKATGHFHSPAQNFVYADVNGNIGLRINGVLPIKYPGEGKTVKKGTKSENKWSKFLPRIANPQTYNPELGFVSSANQISTGPDYPHPYNGGFEDYRGRRINQLLESKDKFTVDDMKNFQQDIISLKAADILPTLLEVAEPSNDLEKEMLETLTAWDYSYDYTLTAPVHFNGWLKTIETMCWDEVRKDSIIASRPEVWRMIELAIDQPDHKVFDIIDTKEIENFSDLANRALKQYTLELDMNEDYTWGAQMPAKINHLLNIPAYSRQNLKLSGTGEVLNAVKNGHGPSWRMVVSMEKEVKAWGVYPGGQSGNVFSPHYDDLIDTWSKGDYYELLSTKDEETIRSRSKISQTMKPINE